ncbi:acyl-CoA dehydrogenase [Psychrobacter frigidicola]|uniref:Acyl-CoA dehydrogenase n=1 Tax=Psychrobacter frigidicola TaxID=45611 RepID=A0A5C7A6H6_9GAMM|nr:acyl-CoA dehydrogenase family protein [Psychrobacter frigidicola]TXD98084.1 acyl-CoA dehydrogenase [Psychrobacter frigidicola]
MLLVDAKNPSLQNIKAAVEDIISLDNQAISTLVITDKLRHDILDILVTYSNKIPHPASVEGTNSNTLIRWQILAHVAGIDLTIAKWFESHLDALSILHEVGYDKNTDGLWAVWASEGHPDPIYYQQGNVSGTKGWCSGANVVDYALMTYKDKNGYSQLLIIDMQENGIEIDNDEWQAVGMQATDTGTIQFDQVPATNVGAANAYLERVGFWHGAAGVAACWYGATACLATYLITAYQHKPHDYKAMYLGQISTALAVTQQYFHHVADLIDSQPLHSHELAIRQLRSNVEQVARLVIETVGQALGATPFCRNAHFARLSADLAVFIRQSHGAFDLQKIGELTSDLTEGQENIWQL